jgi:hypothetical protein
VGDHVGTQGVAIFSPPAPDIIYRKEPEHQTSYQDRVGKDQTSLSEKS